ncbi:hypothetical protein HELRODRAFT_105574 [Helobdella robusta]|uniref:Uncharacterized protein n=1 Tax=Helobdella robusta TaxID=6412 RepID=T1EDW3_HELRO|nr:hypothetical protein HELRODRAFT_105574 [Helobdella robusta]ESO12851.1 hypothetical protein HELRODRAFT_105574 [Helobdella robusta]
MINNSFNSSNTTLDSSDDIESVNTETGSTADDTSRCTDSTAKQGSLRRKRPKKDREPKSKLQFTCTNYLMEGHGQPIFGVQFNEIYRDEWPPLFASVGSNQISIYECSRTSPEVTLLSTHVDTDSEENFFTCAWSIDDELGVPILAAAGSRGIIRILSPCTHRPVKNYIGHGMSVNELRFSTKDSNILLSISKDHTLRLWNIKTDLCIAIFGGVEGHRDELLSGDIDFDGQLLISCGMDHSFKIWKLDNPYIVDAIEKSYKYDKKNKNDKPFKTYSQHFPDFSTRDIHNNYVDCVRWWGKFVLSKSCDNKIVCWKPNRLSTFDTRFIKTSDGHVTSVLHKFDFSACEIWFMRFSLDYDQKILAVGSQTGKIFVWDLDVEDISDARQLILTHPKCNTPVRQLGISRDGTIIIAVCDDGTLWRWDRTPA